MKKLFLIITLLTFSGLQAQYGNTYTVLSKLMATGTVTVKIDSVAYTSSTIDTSKAYSANGWSQHFVYVETKDSASVIVGVQTSRNDVFYTPTQTVDSLVTTSNTGAGKTIDISAKVNGCSSYKVTLGFTSGTPQGVSSAKYSGYLARKNR